jgi:uncharacterized protein YraI
MKRLIISIVVVLATICANAQTQSSVTTVNLNLRTSADIKSKVIDVIPSGTEVTLFGSSNESWSLVLYDGKVGWARSIYLRPIHDKSSGSVTYYTNSRGERVQSPTHYSSAPRGATARCVDGTYSFSKSRRGTCSHHGGVAEWL